MDQVKHFDISSFRIHLSKSATLCDEQENMASSGDD